MIAKVNEFNTDVLIVGMTAPKKKRTYIHKTELNVKIVCTIIAVFDFFVQAILTD